MVLFESLHRYSSYLFWLSICAIFKFESKLVSKLSPIKIDAIFVVVVVIIQHECCTNGDWAFERFLNDFLITQIERNHFLFSFQLNLSCYIGSGFVTQQFISQAAFHHKIMSASSAFAIQSNPKNAFNFRCTKEKKKIYANIIYVALNGNQ